MIVKKLKPEQYSRLAAIFDKEFSGSDLPETHNSEILVAYENSKMVGFILIEDIKMIGQIYVVPEKRNSSIQVIQNLVKSVKERIAPKNVVGAVASETRFEALFKAFGLQKIDGKFFRKNLD